MHRSGELRKEREMKKNLVALLLVLAVVSVGLFAETTDDFIVQTNVPAIGAVKITAGQFNPNPVMRNSLTEAGGYVGPHTVSQSGDQGFTGYVSAISNNRGGFTIKMKATPMKSPEFGAGYYDYIDYTVQVGSVAFTTEGAGTSSTAKQIYTTPAVLQGLTPYTAAITLIVDDPSFQAALAGEGYQGTVTFEYLTK